MNDLLYSAKVLRRIGLLGLENPIKLAKAGLALAKWGTAFPAGVNAAAARYPDQLAVIDDAGEITWREMVAQINRVTQVIKDHGIQPGDAVALLARNHRWMVISLVALMQAGAKILLLNTMATRSQLSELAEREGALLVIADDEFLPLLDNAVWNSRVLLSWIENGAHEGFPSLASEAAKVSDKPHKKPSRPGRIIIFTSGTTGLPKGAKREEPKNLFPLITYFGSIPFTGNQRIVLSAPLFHSWGLLNFGFCLITVPTFVLRRKFVPEQVLADIEQTKAAALIVVPLMMQRMLNVAPEIIKNADVSSLKITASSGSALPGDVAIKFMDTFTDSIYNFYGATETGWITIAGPKDLREAPGTAGMVPWRTTVKVLDHDGNEMRNGHTGVIHVANEMMFGGYTDGRNKAFAHGLMNTGDLGYFDKNGRMFVSGRDDDMIISGGENVFPRELEDKLIMHEAIHDVVVTGVEDNEWGQRLVAYVVLCEEAKTTEAELLEYAKRNVPRFAVPKRIVFLDDLPRNHTGKVMKRELPAINA